MTRRRQLDIVAAGILIASVAGCGRQPDDAAAASASPVERRVQIHTVVLNKPAPPAPLTSAELQLQAKLEREAEQSRPTHRLTLHNGRTVEGRVVGETASSVRLREGFGYSGYTVTPYARADIAETVALPAEGFTISPADVRFANEFADFHFVKAPPYSFVTDESYGEVQKMVRLLTELRGQFEQTFAPLIRPGAKPRDIQVVFFSREERFRDYAQRAAPALTASAGFYSTRHNRLALLNQLGSEHYLRTSDRLATRQRELAGFAAADPRALYEVQARLVSARADITSEAKSMTERLVRHEGAHQLFHCYGVHSTRGLEPTWLAEGLATYCEPAEIGRWHAGLAERLAAARRAGTLIPLEKLLNHDDPAGFFVLGTDTAPAGYAQSWALLQYLMQPQRRGQFYELIRRYRTLSADDGGTLDHAGMLAAALGVDLESLDADWQQYLARF